MVALKWLLEKRFMAQCHLGSLGQLSSNTGCFEGGQDCGLVVLALFAH